MDDLFEATPVQGVESPCVLVCTLDRATGWCLGCGRDASEITYWTSGSDADRRAILDRLPARLARLAAR